MCVGFFWGAQTLELGLNLPVKISKMVVGRKRKQAVKYVLDCVNRDSQDTKPFSFVYNTLSPGAPFPLDGTVLTHTV